MESGNWKGKWLEIPNLSRHDYKEKISWKDFGEKLYEKEEKTLRIQRKEIQDSWEKIESKRQERSISIRFQENANRKVVDFKIK